MEAVFDNNADIVNANIRTAHDTSVLYSVTTTFGLRGRKFTVLRDANPLPGMPATVGLIHWRDKALEIHGVKKPVSQIRRTEGRFLKKSQHWQWASERKEFEVKYDRDGWKATLDHNLSTAARFSVPFRPHLFTKPAPPLLHLTRTALAEDEVFLILVLIYAEARRQDKTNSSSVNGGVGW